jgi:hypothetical protein
MLAEYQTDSKLWQRFIDPKNGGNGNGMIDPGDTIWPKLLVWIDANHNGISEPDELFSLSQGGIFSISRTYNVSQKTDQYGNVPHFFPATA